MVNAVEAVVAGMQVDELRMRLVAHNAANALTPGFKRQFAAVQLAAAEGGGMAPVVRTITDARPAPLLQTSDPMDLAIEGEGFFEVQRNGETLFTRRGSFRPDPQGRLVDEEGWALQGQAGDVVVGGASLRIDGDGAVYENDKPVGQVRLMVLPEGAVVEAAGGSRLRTSSLAQPAAAGEAGRIRQGYLERSNVDSASEMVRVLETVRHYEGGQRALQALSALNEQLLRTLGSF